MGRENGEDYGTEFLVMLNTWGTAVEFLRPRGRAKTTLDIARFLGWIREQSAALPFSASPLMMPLDGPLSCACACGPQEEFVALPSESSSNIPAGNNLTERRFR